MIDIGGDVRDNKRQRVFRVTEQDMIEWIEGTARKGSFTLSFRDMGLTTLPDAIGQLSQLRELYLSGNQLTTLPDSIGQLVRLKTLYVQNNQLTMLPDSIGQLINLQTLYLQNN